MAVPLIGKTAPIRIGSPVAAPPLTLAPGLVPAALTVQPASRAAAATTSRRRRGAGMEVLRGAIWAEFAPDR